MTGQAQTPGQAAYEARMEAAWGSDWALCEPNYSELDDPDRASWEDTALRFAAAQERPAPELAAAMRETRLMRDAIAKLTDDLKTSAAATHPSKKSEIQFELIHKLQKILEGK